MSKFLIKNNDILQHINLDTILMIKDILSKKYEFASKNKLRLSLPKQLAIQDI
jgi:hypothetical protein